jgi:Heterokaryon incompatibility protein (HET)
MGEMTNPPTQRDAPRSRGCPPSTEATSDSQAPFEYKSPRLRSALKEIRLLELLPGCENDPVHCRLSTHLPLSRPQYEALSYCWGHGTEKITCDNALLGITLNLFYALKRLRTTDQSRILWVDAICINQGDVDERSEQVPLMQDIYRNCEKVLVWLGGEASSGRAVGFLDTLGRKIANYCHDLSRAGYHDTEHKMVDKYLVTLAKSYRDEFQTKEFEESWMDVIGLLRSPWWSRCWVVQEFILATRVSVFYGPFQMDWNLFAGILLQVHQIYKQIIKKCISGDDLHPMLSADLTLVFSMIQQTTGSWRGLEKRDLMALLEDSRHRECSDLRDKVYAFLGLTNDYGIIPNYDPFNTTIEVYTDAARKIILHDRKLDLLSHAENICNRTTPALPSWVPVWSSERERSNMLLYTNSKPREVLQYFESGEYCSSGELYADASFFTISNNHVLQVQCLIIDQVATRATLEKSGTERKDKRAHWSAIAYHGSEGTRYFTGENIEDAILGISVLGMGIEILRDCNMLDGQREENMGRESDDKEVRDEAESRMRLLLGDTSNGEWCFFRSPQGYMGLVRPEAEHTDFICVLLGATVPYVLRRQGDYYSLIGEAYVHGLMHGYAIDLMNANKLDNVTIKIV